MATLTDITLNYYNETYIKVTCSDSIGAELGDYFSFDLPVFVAYRSRTKKIRLYNRHTKRIYRGLIPYIQEFCKEFGYTLEVKDDLDLTNEISLYEVEEFAKVLKLHTDGKPIVPRDYQIKYVAHILRNKRALILSPTSSGKSLTIYMVLRFLRAFKFKCLLVVPTTGLIYQMFNDFCDYSSVNKWNSDQNIHEIFEGRDKVSDKPIYLATWQSIFNLSEEYFKQFDCVIVDEAHGAPAKCLKGILEKCINAQYKIGLTGTLDGTQTNQLVLEGLFGPIVQKITTKQLIDRGEASNFQIKCIGLKYSNPPSLELSYHEEIDHLLFHEQRNKFIKNLALSLKTNTLILFRYVEKHGEVVFESIRQATQNSKRNVYFISGKTDAEIRDSIRAIVEKENDAIIVASIGTFATGVNIKNLHNIIAIMPTKGRIKLLQSIGRALRLHDSKDVATLFDIWDDFGYENYSKKHVIERMRIYHSEQFDVQHYKVKLS